MLEDYTPFLPQGLVKAIQQRGTFNTLHVQAMEQVKTITGYTDNDLTTMSSRIKIAIAWLIQYYADDHVSNTSPEYATRIERQYKSALEILEQNKKPTATATGATAGVGEIGGLW